MSVVATVRACGKLCVCLCVTSSVAVSRSKRPKSIVRAPTVTIRNLTCWNLHSINFGKQNHDLTKIGFFEFTIGQGQVIKGWDSGVATMHKGEKATLICRSDYAYGEHGSPPKIPGGATLNFEVELFSWKEARKEKWQLTDEQKLEEDRQPVFVKTCSLYAQSDWSVRR